MFRIVSLMLIFISISCAGFIYAERFTKREKQLKELNRALAFLKNEVIFLCAPIEEAFEKISEKCDGCAKQIFANTKEEIKHGKVDSVYEAFNKEYLKVKDKMYLNHKDEDLLADFFKSLGESNVTMQEALFDFTEQELGISINEAHELSKKNVKLYRYLGICIGSMIVIFLI